MNLAEAADLSDCTQSGASLRMERVRIAFGLRVLLDDLNFELRAGEAVVISGANGSGKTSLLRMAAGIARPAAGSVHSRFRRTGYVPQMQNVDRQFPISVRDLLHMSFVGVGYLTRPALRRDRARRIQEVLDQVGMGHLGHLQLRTCSGGELQRAMIGRALALDPDFLILDEPTAALDLTGKRAVFELLENLRRQRGVAILMTSHETITGTRLVYRRMRIAAGGVRAENSQEAGDV